MPTLNLTTGTLGIANGGPPATGISTPVTVEVNFVIFLNSHPWIRFDGITIPKSTNITSANISISWLCYTNISGYLWPRFARNANNPGVPTNAVSVTSTGTGTGAKLANTLTSAAAGLGFYQGGTTASPKQGNTDCTSLVQDLVNQWDYNSQAMVFYYHYNITSGAYTSGLYVQNFNYAGNEPVLTINYSVLISKTTYNFV